MYGFARYDNSRAKNKRQVAFSTYSASNEGEYRQQGGAVELGAGWKKKLSAGTLNYNAGVNYAIMQQGAFTEGDGHGSALRQEQGSYRSALGSLGVQYTTDMAKLNKLTDYRVSAAATWNQELYRSDRDYSVSLLGGNIPVHWENNEDKGWLYLSLQGQFVYKKNLAVTASLGTELFRKNHRGVSGSVKLEYGF
ncbi:MAG: autotransporter outer membrane beta-barrel domain-containing protein [Phascolarctobacterium sp.]|nr:autotransporter outer membrane beta-barrel domain-containing protein [Phascolarctobacterium sp.]